MLETCRQGETSRVRGRTVGEGNRWRRPRKGAGEGLIARAVATAVLMLSIAIPHPAIAGSSRGGTFLPMGWSARGAGLGGAASILIRDDRSAFWNPANVCFLLSPRISVGTTKPVPDLDNWYTVLSAGTGLLDDRTADGVTPVMKRIGVALTATHLGLELAGGSGWNEGTLGLSIAFAPNHYNSIGITYRVMKSWTDLEDAGSWGMAVDAGWTAILTEHIWFALVGRNIYSGISYPNVDEELDPLLAVAIAYERLLDRISLESDAVMKNGALDKVLVGSYVRLWDEMLYISGGAEMRVAEDERTILSFGVGSVLNSIETAVAFSFDPEEAFGRRTRVSVSYLF
jgi:hypothetical protein